MSKIGKQPVQILDKVTVTIADGEILVKGPKGELKRKIRKDIAVEIKDNTVLVSPKGNAKSTKAMHGTFRMLVSNMIQGVSEGWIKKLELVGTGYRAEVSGKNLVLNIGFSHPVTIEPPDGISFKVEKSIVIVEGIDKEVVGQVSANIRAVRPPEPYKGKGIKYEDEYVRRKAGKAAKTAA